MKVIAVCLLLLLITGSSVVAQDTPPPNWSRMEESIFDLTGRGSLTDAMLVDSSKAYAVGLSAVEKHASLGFTKDGANTWNWIVIDTKRYAYTNISAAYTNKLLVFGEGYNGYEENSRLNANSHVIRRLELGDTTVNKVVWESGNAKFGTKVKWHNCFSDGSAYASFYYGSETDSGIAVIKSKDFGITWGTAYTIA